jgi:hypothetical protein
VTTPDAIARLFTEPALDPAWFSPNFLASVPMDKVTTILSDVVGTLGAYKGIEPNGSSYTLTFARGTLQAEATIDDAAVFTGLTFNRMQSAIAEERLTALLQTSEIPTAWFSDLFLAAVPIEQVTSIVADMKLHSGAFRSIFAAPDGTYDVALAKGRYSARIYLGRDGRILGLIFRSQE